MRRQPGGASRGPRGRPRRAAAVRRSCATARRSTTSCGSACRAPLRAALSPRHVPDTVEAVPAIPRTLTGKKLELPVKRILLGAPPKDVASRDALADPGGDRRLRRLRRGPVASARRARSPPSAAPDVIRPAERPDPVAGPGEVVVRIHAATVNPTDLGTRAGQARRRLPDLEPPFVPGWDLAGEVAEVGQGVDGHALGDRVVGMIPFVRIGGRVGAYAEAAAVDPGWLAPLDPAVSYSGGGHAAAQRADRAPGARPARPARGSHAADHRGQRRRRELRHPAGRGRRPARDRRCRPRRRGLGGGRSAPPRCFRATQT